MLLVIALKPEIMLQERSAYTLFTLLGDFGGFQGAIIIFPSFLMSFYSS